MPLKLDKLPDENIAVLTVEQPFEMKSDLPQFWDMLLIILNSVNAPVHLVVDARGMKIPFADIVSILSTMTRSDEAKQVNAHANLGPRHVVADNDILKLAANALKQFQYGNQHVRVYNTLEEALAGVRGELSAQKSI